MNNEEFLTLIKTHVPEAPIEAFGTGIVPTTTNFRDTINMLMVAIDILHHRLEQLENQGIQE